MIGCSATTDPNAVLDIDRKELEDARWFSPSELLAALHFIEKKPQARVAKSTDDGKTLTIFVPPAEALAHQLIKKWLVVHGHYK